MSALEIGGRWCVPAVPILDGSILRLQKPEKAAGGAVPERMAPRFHGVPHLDVLARDSDPLEPSAAGRFESPDLRLTFFVLDFKVAFRRIDGVMKVEEPSERWT